MRRDLMVKLQEPQRQVRRRRQEWRRQQVRDICDGCLEFVLMLVVDFLDILRVEEHGARAADTSII